MESKEFSSTGASKTSDAVKLAARFIHDQVYGSREIRVGFSEKRVSSEFGPRLVPAYVFPPNATGNVHNYPLSVAGWSVVEARIIAWPDERYVACDFQVVERLGKLRELTTLVEDDRLINAPPYVARYVDPQSVKAAFKNRTLKLGDFYQDWVGSSPAARYSQFISVPVAISERDEDETSLGEYGVFNIDSFEREPLLDAQTEAMLKSVARHIAEVYARLA